MREKLNIIQKMTYAEYVNSKYPEMECDNFGYNHLMKAELERWIKYDPQVFVCNADPKFNYGLNFKVYLRYQLPDEKLWIFAPISFGSSSLTSAPFFTVDSVEFLNLDEDTLNKIASLGGEYLIRKVILVNTDRLYNRSGKARKWLAEAGFTVCISL